MLPAVLLAIATMLLVDLVDRPRTVAHASLEIFATALAVVALSWLGFDYVRRALRS